MYKNESNQNSRQRSRITEIANLINRFNSKIIKTKRDVNELECRSIDV